MDKKTAKKLLALMEDHRGDPCGDQAPWDHGYSSFGDELRAGASNRVAIYICAVHLLGFLQARVLHFVKEAWEEGEESDDARYALGQAHDYLTDALELTGLLRSAQLCERHGTSR